MECHSLPINIILHKTYVVNYKSSSTSSRNSLISLFLLLLFPPSAARETKTEGKHFNYLEEEEVDVIEWKAVLLLTTHTILSPPPLPATPLLRHYKFMPV